MAKGDNENNSEKNSIEQLHRQMYYDHKDQEDKEGFSLPRSEKKEVKEDWGKMSKSKNKQKKTKSKQSNFAKKFFYGALIFFALALIIAFFSWGSQSQTVSSRNIDINIDGQNFTSAGDELEMNISVTNRNNANLELADLLIEYPRGSALEDETEMERLRVGLGDIEAGGTASESVPITLFGQEGDEVNVNVVLEYRVSGSNAIFHTDTVWPVSIDSSPVEFTVDSPESISSEQEVNFQVNVKSNTDSTLENILLLMENPFGFEFVSSNPDPSFSDNIWQIGDLSAGEEKTIDITGRLAGQDGEERNFRFQVGSADQHNERRIALRYGSAVNSITIERPSLAANLELNSNDGREHVADPQTSISGRISWSNNLDETVEDLRLNLGITGEALSTDSVSASTGFYNSLQNEIVWSSEEDSGLSSVSPGDGGDFSFSFSSGSLFSGGNLIEDPSIYLDLKIQAIDQDGQLIDIDMGQTVVKINSNLNLSVQALHYSGPFENSGPMPPRAEETTTYSIVWNITNSSNRINNVEVTGTLPSYIDWQNLTSPASENISFDESNREIKWSVGNVQRGAGISGADRKEGAFHLALTPSVGQIGEILDLIRNVQISGEDNFTGQVIEINRGDFNTNLRNNEGFETGQGQVVE